MRGTLQQTVLAGRQVTVYQPAVSGRLPVLYVLDGTRLWPAPLALPLIVVGVAPKDRLAEYTPWPAARLDPRFPDFGGQGKDHLAFLTSVVKPYIDGRYPTNPAAAHTGIAGASLGGLLAVYAQLEYPQVFGSAAALSGSFWYEGWAAYLKRQPAKLTGQRLYLDVGRAEGCGKTSRQRHIVAKTRQTYAALQKRWPAAGQVKLQVWPALTHQLAYFQQRLPQAAAWLLMENN